MTLTFAGINLNAFSHPAGDVTGTPCGMAIHTETTAGTRIIPIFIFLYVFLPLKNEAIRYLRITLRRSGKFPQTDFCNILFKTQDNQAKILYK